MQTPSILQQITPPNSQVKKNSEFNDSNRLNSNTESPSPFKKILNNEVNNQNKNKISSSNIKNEAPKVNKDHKSVNTNESIEDVQSEEDSISLSNQNILFFVEDIEQLKDPKNVDFLNKDQLLAQDDLQGIQALVPSLQIKTENTAPPVEENGILKDTLKNKAIDLVGNAKAKDLASESPSPETLIPEALLPETLSKGKEINDKSIQIDLTSKKNPITDSLKVADFSIALKNENTILKTMTPPPTVLNKELDIGKATLFADEKNNSKITKKDKEFPIESLSKSTLELPNKINQNMKIELNSRFEAPPIDLKDISSVNLTPKIDANLTNQLGVSPEQLKASGLANYIPAQLGTKAWDQAMGQRIIWMVTGGEQSAQLTLNPPDLGPLQVVLKISDNQVDASFISSHLDVRDTLESAMPKLRQMMDDAGIQLSGFSVNSQASQSGQNFTQENTSPQTRSIETSQDTNMISIDNSVTKVIKKELGLVDTFV